MKLPAARTLESALSPLNKLNWTFGMGVIQYPDGKPHPIMSVCWTMLQLIIFLILFKITDVSALEVTEDAELVAQCYQVSVYTLTIAYLVCICAAKLNTAALRSCAQNMDYVNRTMRIFGIPDDYDVTFKTLCFQTTIATIFGTILMGIDFGFMDYEFPTESQRVTFLIVVHHVLIVVFVADWTFNAWIRNVHRELCRIAKEVNKAFAIPLLLCMTTTFIVVTSLLLSDYVSIMALRAKPEVEEIMITIANITWTIANGVRILIAVRNCSNTNEQAHKTGKIIHNLGLSTTNAEIHEEICIFSLQLIQNPLYFTAYDLFILDYKLIGSMTDSIVTILVIMIQKLPAQNFERDATDLTISTSPTSPETLFMNSTISLETE